MQTHKHQFVVSILNLKGLPFALHSLPDELNQSLEFESGDPYPKKNSARFQAAVGQSMTVQKSNTQRNPNNCLCFRCPCPSFCVPWNYFREWATIEQFSILGRFLTPSAKQCKDGEEVSQMFNFILELWLFNTVSEWNWFHNKYNFILRLTRYSIQNSITFSTHSSFFENTKTFTI